MFEFSGTIESSKSLVNRALIIQSYESQIQLDFSSQSKDILVLQKAFTDFFNGHKEFHCGDAGTAFRFLILRLSREPGTWIVSGSERLLSRPQEELIALLDQWDVSVDVQDRRWILQSTGWKPRSEIRVNTSVSSQFASSILLNAWNLPNDLTMEFTGRQVSEAYLAMTLDLVRRFGMDIIADEKSWLIRAQQKPRQLNYTVEADVSSCFALASCAVQNGQARILNFPFDSQQPDIAFLTLFKRMGVRYSRDEQDLLIEKTEHLNPLTYNLRNTPDLFPVLATLCARAQGKSFLTGLDHLSHKESDRLTNTIQLLKRLGRKTELMTDQLVIHGDESPFESNGDFNPDQDHRMAMAARVANLYGARLNILHPMVVDKSFPQFWQATGGL